jgi:hypothetical protein
LSETRQEARIVAKFFPTDLPTPSLLLRQRLRQRANPPKRGFWI